ncbi:MAG: ATP-dependent DNA helicase RecG [Rhodobacteraceae bacterium]|nr:ATP-dependent DNA helicase RecG [Paracoccaceae bacterium]
MMREDVLFPLFAEQVTLPGVGPKNRTLFEKVAGGPYVRDLVLTAPTGVIDRALRDTILGAPEGAVVTVEVEIGSHRPNLRKGKQPYRIDVTDAGTTFHLIFFHAHGEYLNRLMPTGERRVISGKVERFDSVYQMPHPDHMVPLAEASEIPLSEPIYPLTAGLSLRVLGKVMRAALETVPELPEWLDPAFQAREAMPPWRDAVLSLHAPQGLGDIEPTTPARRRLAYDELLAHQLGLGLARDAMRSGREGGGAVSTQGDGRLRAAVLAQLPFKPTSAQDRAVAEIAADMATPLRMMRLLQGDVGAGKTLVALLSMLIAVEAGGQAALMAPTDILARQHLDSLTPLAAAAGVRLGALTGRDKGRAREDKLEMVASGEIDILVGTHALFQRGVDFKELRLAVIDEQHRFGVAQRMALAEKGGAADVLAMTATPIPRTLALANYGDMDVSILDEKPPGRIPIETRLVSIDRYEEVVAGVARAIAGGARAYWVCPLVEESEVIDVAAAEERSRVLAATLGAQTVALTHGRLPAAEKDAAMARFVAGEAKVLVATTVIEVGVNVPEATLIVIEHAERFGLAQLHQLRGRVGRGGDASHCLLLYGGPLSEAGRARLSIMRETEDGFRLAEEDLRLRGAGDLLGVKQSGLPAFRVADVERQGDLMKTAQDDARLALSQDPTLTNDRGQALRLLLQLMGRDEAMKYLGSG